MTAPEHVYEIFIKAPSDKVWQAIIDPAFTRRYFHQTAFEAILEPGSTMRYVLPNGDTAVDGVIEVVEPGERLTMTWRVRYDAELEAEPASRVEWTLTPVTSDDTITRVTLRHYDLAMSPATAANVRLGWVAIIDGMKTLLETGEELGDVEVEVVRPHAGLR